MNLQGFWLFNVYLILLLNEIVTLKRQLMLWGRMRPRCGQSSGKKSSPALKKVNRF